MVERAHALEDALQIECQSEVEHPLLAPELLVVNRLAAVDGEGQTGAVEDTKLAVKSGMLVLSAEKGELFLGSTAVEVCVKLCHVSASAHRFQDAILWVSFAALGYDHWS